MQLVVNKRNLIWSYLLVLTPVCMGIFGCKQGVEEATKIEVELYTTSDLDYPEDPIKITNGVTENYLQNFFLPWNLSPEQVVDSLDSFPGKNLSYLQNYLEDDEWYGENKKPHKRVLREEIVENVELGTFPNFQKKGIVIAHTNLRRIPSNRPGFDTYSKAGEGFPFDYFQETNLWANTPLQLLHLTNDKQWCYAVSPYYKGWVALHDLAIVTDDFISAWKTGHYAMPKSDAVNLSDPSSNYAINAKMGMVLPYENSTKGEQILAFYTNADENQNAVILKAAIDKDKVALADFRFEKDKLKILVSNLIGRPYGWGGNLENRDCSSMIRDLMATYQVWLPRDSKDQIDIGQQFELTGSLEEKMQLIKAKAIPFQTILRKKGHNMLYVGENERGEPLIFHAIWGLKTTYSNKKLATYLVDYPLEGIHHDEDGALKGRHILGESVITSVLAGSGNEGVTRPLLDEIYTMTNILENLKP
ncbi:SH3 domain-containing C40 family peptidase [Croceivirga thetidis]|uniref:Glycoside hydrolase n=1 Tax=Croceivirga thetidis TaxID=2721623 RepID=A0ABX1GQK1_9FLAO|nr:SH3 domain-containing C40 family peptidase [Croceivirga thetidis]NKI32191.1 hypothetical protein [Croceivirga thetidis]